MRHVIHWIGGLHVPLLLFAAYLVVEVGVLVLLASTIGLLWTLALVVATSVLGVTLIRSQGRRVIAAFRSAARHEREPGVVVADGALVAAGSVLLAVPGLVCSLIGLLLLIPATRALVRPVITASVARMIGRGRVGQRTAFGAGTVIIDGEVVAPTGHTGKP